MKFTIDFSKKLTWGIIAVLCGIGYVGVYTIQEMTAKDIQNQNTIQQLKVKDDENEQKIRDLLNENQEKHRQIIQLQNENKYYEQEKFLFEQGKEARIMLASSIKDDVRVIKSQLNEFKEVVTLLENHVNQIENQNYQNT